ATRTARGTGNAIFTGTSITRLPHPIRRVEARANLGAPRQKALKISGNEHVLPPCCDVIA
ncbi:MAG: hypothetical protein WBE50_11845, partial [Methyloceanibacter sp.]